MKTIDQKCECGQQFRMTDEYPEEVDNAYAEWLRKHGPHLNPDKIEAAALRLARVLLEPYEPQNIMKPAFFLAEELMWFAKALAPEGGKRS